MSEIQHKRGKFVAFRATTKFHLGEKQRDIWEGDEIEFDGQTVKHQGEEFGAPSIRGAVKAGWLVPAEDNVSKYIPKSANVVVHAATSTGRDRGEPITIGHTQDEEMEVGRVEGHRERVKAAVEREAAPRTRAKVASQPKPEPQPMDIIDELSSEELAALSEDELIALGMQDEEPVEPEATTAKRPRSTEEADEVNLPIFARALAAEVPKTKDFGGTRHDSVSDEPPAKGKKKYAYTAAADDQGGQVVRTVSTSAPGVSVGAEGVRLPAQGVDVTKVTPSAVEASMKPIGGGKRPHLPVPGTLTPPTDIASVRARKVAEARRLIAEKAAKEAKRAAKKKVTKKKAAKKKAPPHGGAPTGVVTLADPVPEEADFQHKIPKGEATQVTEGESMKSNGTTGDVKETRAADELVDLLPDAIIAGAKPSGAIIGQDPNGFSWDKSLHWKTRVSLAVKNYGNQPEMIKQILATETPTVAKQIRIGLDKGKSV